MGRVHCAAEHRGRKVHRRKEDANDDDDDDDTIGTKNNRIDCWHFGLSGQFHGRHEM